jgi:hypothetical protein
VGREADFFSEFERHGGAVREHVTDMTRGQPEADQQGQNDKRYEQNRKRE